MGRKQGAAFEPCYFTWNIVRHKQTQSRAKTHLRKNLFGSLVSVCLFDWILLVSLSLSLSLQLFVFVCFALCCFDGWAVFLLSYLFFFFFVCLALSLFLLSFLFFVLRCFFWWLIWHYCVVLFELLLAFAVFVIRLVVCIFCCVVLMWFVDIFKFLTFKKLFGNTRSTFVWGLFSVPLRKRSLRGPLLNIVWCLCCDIS